MKKTALVRAFVPCVKADFILRAVPEDELGELDNTHGKDTLTTAQRLALFYIAFTMC